jgi:hypothetical protein
MASRSKSRSQSRSVRRQRSKQRTQRRSQSGGSWGNYPDSAWGYQMNNLGNGWTQFMNSLSVQPGQNLGTSQSNDIVPVNNVNAQDTTKMLTGGKKHKHKRNKMRHLQQMQMQMQQQQMQQQMQQSKSQSRGKKGGYWGAVLEQAAVPLALLGMQQAYGNRHTRRHGSSYKKSFKRRR